MPSDLTLSIPTCNGSRHIAATLRSVLEQLPSEVELLVSDDCSEDDTLAQIQAIAGDRARVSVNQARLGLAGNWNRCVELASSEWVAIVHQDDLLLPGHLARHLKLQNERPDLGLICSRAGAIDDEGNAVSPAIVAPDHLGDHDCVYESGQFVEELAVENPVRCSGVSFRKAAHAEVGGFDPALRYVLDWRFWVQLAGRYPVAWLALASVAFRWHGESETERLRSSGCVDLDEQRALCDWIHDEHGQTWHERARLRHAADRRLAHAYLNRAYEAARAGNRGLELRCLRSAAACHAPTALAGLMHPRLLGRLVLGRVGG